MYKFRQLCCALYEFASKDRGFTRCIDCCLRGIYFADHGVRHEIATDGSTIRMAPKVRVNTSPMGVVQGILVVLAS